MRVLALSTLVASVAANNVTTTTAASSGNGATTTAAAQSPGNTPTTTAAPGGPAHPYASYSGAKVNCAPIAGVLDFGSVPTQCCHEWTTIAAYNAHTTTSSPYKSQIGTDCKADRCDSDGMTPTKISWIESQRRVCGDAILTIKGSADCGETNYKAALTATSGSGNAAFADLLDSTSCAAAETSAAETVDCTVVPSLFGWSARRDCCHYRKTSYSWSKTHGGSFTFDIFGTPCIGSECEADNIAPTTMAYVDAGNYICAPANTATCGEAAHITQLNANAFALNAGTAMALVNTTEIFCSVNGLIKGIRAATGACDIVSGVLSLGTTSLQHCYNRKITFAWYATNTASPIASTLGAQITPGNPYVCNQDGAFSRTNGTAASEAYAAGQPTLYGLTDPKCDSDNVPSDEAFMNAVQEICHPENADTHGEAAYLAALAAGNGTLNTDLLAQQESFADMCARRETMWCASHPTDNHCVQPSAGTTTVASTGSGNIQSTGSSGTTTAASTTQVTETTEVAPVRKVQAQLSVTLPDLPHTATGASLLASTAFTGAIKNSLVSNLAATVSGLSASDITIIAIRIINAASGATTAAPTTATTTAPTTSTATTTASSRRLSGSDPKIEVDYEVTVAAADATALATAVDPTAGTASTFATALGSSLGSELTTAGLSYGTPVAELTGTVVNALAVSTTAAPTSADVLSESGAYKSGASLFMAVLAAAMALQ